MLMKHVSAGTGVPASIPRPLLRKGRIKAKWVLRTYVTLPTYHPCSYLPAPERIARELPLQAIEQPHIEGGAEKKRKSMYLTKGGPVQRRR